MRSKLSKLIGVLSPRLNHALTCESCGQEFSCGASLRGCWCAEIQLTEATRAELKKQFRECLCRECLQKYSSAPVAHCRISDVDNVR